MSLTSTTVPPSPDTRIRKRTDYESLTLLQFESGPSRKRCFAFGYVAQCIILALLARVAVYSPTLVRPAARESVELIAPSLAPLPKPKVPRIVAPKLPKPIPPPTPPIETPAPPLEANVEPPQPLPEPVAPTPAAPKPVMNTFAPAAPPSLTPAPPKPEVKTDVFAGSSAKPTIKAAPEQVQTGGFGDANGFKGHAEEAKLNVPKVGAFDQPAGPGSGNGYAGAKGKSGVVASAGFGSGVAVVQASSETPGGGVHSGGFGDARAGSAGAGSIGKGTSTAAMQPVEVLEKPQPQYTQEARDLKIEGEVYLKVLFQADGHVQVLQVVRGLGHGLDQAATVAAQRIRFRPAQRDGRPCDMTATVHIVFQLAS